MIFIFVEVKIASYSGMTFTFKAKEKASIIRFTSDQENFYSVLGLF